MTNPRDLSDYSKVRFAVFGAGGFGREVMAFAYGYLQSLAHSFASVEYEIVFVESVPSADTVGDIPIIAEDQLCQDVDACFFNVAIGDGKDRRQVVERCIDLGALPVELHAPSTLLYPATTLGDGAILCPNTLVASNTTIGKFFHANFYSYVAHDCIVGDYVTFAPRVSCNGNVEVQDGVYIGTGAVIRNGSSDKKIVIGKNAVVGMGAVVTRDVPEDTTVVGNPARPLR